MYEQFRLRAEGVGAEIHRFGTSGEALAFLEEFLQTEGQPAVWAGGGALSGIDPAALAARVPELGFAVNRETAAAAHVGITAADWGVADTGSLVADQAAVEQRLASSLPTIHVALIGTGRIVADKTAVFARINPGTSGYIAFITGPSRTADIERVLTIGVHGPKRLVILCIDDLDGGSQ